MDDDRVPPSHRARKRAVNEGVRRLLDTPGWNPYLRGAGTDAPAARARDALRQVRVERAEDAAKSCPDCEAARHGSGDSTDLCARHLAEAMGLQGHQDPGSGSP
jgi:hypothetical protein